MTLTRALTNRRLPKRRSPWDTQPPDEDGPARATRAIVDDALSADTFDEAAVAALAQRDTYPDAAAYLDQLANVREGLVKPLLESSAIFAPYRFAIRFRAVPADFDSDHTLTIDDLRVKNSPEARLALVALGVERDWRTMNRRERAVLALRALVGAMQNRFVTCSGSPGR